MLVAGLDSEDTALNKRMHLPTNPGKVFISTNTASEELWVGERVEQGSAFHVSTWTYILPPAFT